MDGRTRPHSVGQGAAEGSRDCPGAAELELAELSALHIGNQSGSWGRFEF